MTPPTRGYLSAVRWGRFTFHPDGRQALFTAGPPRMERWVMEGFLDALDSPGQGDGR